jgi:AcrR family transcriptional regulator
MKNDLSKDRRIIRTRLVIRAALAELIEEKGFDGLTVKDITTRANINRGTFYLHYQDKLDLLKQTEAEVAEDIEKLLLKADLLHDTDFNSMNKPLPVLVIVFDYLKENAPLMRAIFGLQGGAEFQGLIRKIMEKSLKIGFLVGMKTENFLVPGDYLISYVISAHFGVVYTWLQKGCPESPKEMALILSRLSFDGPVRSTGVILS